jgi:hypothetical protein
MPRKIVRKTTTTTIEEFADDGDETIEAQGHVDDQEDAERDDDTPIASRTTGRAPAASVKPAAAGRSRSRSAG